MEIFTSFHLFTTFNLQKYIFIEGVIKQKMKLANDSKHRPKTDGKMPIYEEKCVNWCKCLFGNRKRILRN